MASTALHFEKLMPAKKKKKNAGESTEDNCHGYGERLMKALT